MTDAKQKPREFWISDPEEFSEDVIFNDQKYTNDDSRYIHVIEKAYVDKLLVRIEKLREGLKQLRTDKIAIELLKQDDEAKNE